MTAYLDRPAISEREQNLIDAVRATLEAENGASLFDGGCLLADQTRDELTAALQAYDPPAPGAIAPEDPRAILREIRAAWPADYDEAVSGADLCETIGALIPRIDAAIRT